MNKNVTPKTNPYVNKLGEKLVITKAGKEFLESAVTDSDGPVYAFYDSISPLMVAAAMARLSRRGDDMREIFLDEFAAAGREDAHGLIHRVVTAYGDDSVQQLVGLHLVVEDASNLLTKLLEWGRFAGYLEQSTRYIYFDQKDKFGKFKYFVPANLPKKLQDEYILVMDEIFKLYSAMVHELTDYVRKDAGEPKDPKQLGPWKGATRAQACDAIRSVLPVATKSTVGIFGSSQAIESLILHLFSEPLLEANTIGQQLLDEARKVIPAFLERTDRPDRGGAITAHRANTRASMAKHSDKSSSKKSNQEEVKLLDYWPKNELDLVPHMLFSTDLRSTEDLIGYAKKMTKAQKVKIFTSYMGERLNRRHKPGRAMEIPHYLWEITADYGTFRDLQRHRVVDAFEWQALGINHGYEIPALVSDAGLVDQFKYCFKLSEKLYKKLVDAGLTNEAQYATLFGHRMRYKFMLNARATFHFIELRSSPQGHPGYRRIVGEMYEKLAKVHPRIGKAMRFVNKDEDPKLTRMAAELATQYKLEQLDKVKKK